MAQLNNFGRAWALRVSSSSDPTAGDVITYSTDTWTPEALRITFVVQQEMRAVWTAEIAIYNLTSQSEQQVLQTGCWVELYGGYQNAQNYGLLFRGRVFQPKWERINGTDYKVTLRCMSGAESLFNNFISTSVSAYSTQADFVRTMAKNAHTPFATTAVDLDSLSKPLPRGKVAFGTVSDYFGQIANDNYASWVPTDTGPALGAIASGSQGADYTYAPPIPLGSNARQQPGVNYTLINTPQQTQSGVSFQVELDSRLKLKLLPGTVVGLNMSQINQADYGPGAQQLPFAQSGEYVVVGITHVGDSRGPDWYTEVTAATPGGVLIAFAQASK